MTSPTSNGTTKTPTTALQTGRTWVAGRDFTVFWSHLGCRTRTSHRRRGRARYQPPAGPHRRNRAPAGSGPEWQEPPETVAHALRTSFVSIPLRSGKRQPSDRNPARRPARTMIHATFNRSRSKGFSASCHQVWTNRNDPVALRRIRLWKFTAPNADEGQCSTGEMERAPGICVPERLTDLLILSRPPRQRRHYPEKSFSRVVFVSEKCVARFAGRNTRQHIDECY